MAYLRFSRTCEWYVFEETSGNLAVWHTSVSGKGVSYTAEEISRMLSEGDFSVIPGYVSEHKDQLTNAFVEWINERQNEN